MPLTAPSLAQSIAANAYHHQRERDALLRDALRLIGDLLPHTTGAPGSETARADGAAA